MSKMTLGLIATVEDRASQPLKKVKDSIKDTGKAVQQTVADWTKFNQTMFTTTAFVGFFSKAVGGLIASVSEGAALERLDEQFSKILGPSGTVFNTISKFTDISIDKMETLRSGIALKSLGIATSSTQVAELVARAGVAAKMAGKDSAEGIQIFTSFLKSSNINHLESLNLMKSSDPAYKTYMAMINKTGGVMANAITTQQRLAMGLELLRIRTKDSMRGFRDLQDVVADAQQNFKLLRNTVGYTLGDALRPFLESFNDLSGPLRDSINYLKTNSDNFLKIGKAILGAGAAVTALVASYGTLRLLVKGLAATGFGIPGLALAFGGLTLAFKLFQDRSDRFNKTLSDSPLVSFAAKVANVAKGVTQLVTSFFDAENSAKGVGKIDKSLKDLLDQSGLMAFTENLSKGVILVTTFAKKVYQNISLVFNTVLDGMDAITSKFTTMFGKKTSLIPRSWLSDSNTLLDTLAKIATAGLGLWGAKGLGKLGQSAGKLFGKGGKGGPSGSKSDPIYTKASGATELVKGIDFKSAAPWASTIGKTGPSTAEEAGKLKTLLANVSNLPLITNLRSVAASASKAAVPLFLFGLAASAAVGAMEGFAENADLFKEGFKGMAFFVSSKAVLAQDWFTDKMDQIKKGIQPVVDFFSKHFSTLITGPLKFAMDAASEVINFAKDKLGFFAENIINPFAAVQELFKSGVGAAAAGVSSLGQAGYSSGVSDRLKHFQNKKQIDYVPETSTERLGFLQTAASDLSATGEQKNMILASAITSGIKDALLGKSEGGKDITQSEFANLLAKTFGVAIDNSVLTKATKVIEQSNTKMAGATDLSSSKLRGGC